MLDRIDIKYFKLAVGLENIGKETDLDITARCPVCGDSRKNKRTKRLHLYEKNGVTNCNCFNGDCGVQNKTVYSFLRDFFPALLPQYKKETFGNTLEKLSKNETADVFSSFKKEPEETLEQPEKVDILLHDLSSYMHKIEENQEALDYLKSRGFDYNNLKDKYGQWYFGFQDLKIGEKNYKITNAIVIPLYYDGKMYGFYSRSIYDKVFFTYMHDANIGYKIWNWFNVDKSKPVYIFEGIFDALSSGFDNVIAAIGAKIPEERINELKEPVFCYDNDKTGMMNSIAQANKGYKVFVQPPGYAKDMNENMLNGVDCRNLIANNLYSGISASIRIKSKL